MDGFYGRVLLVDLAQRRFCVEAPEEGVLLRAIGGKGLASHLLLSLNPPQVDPLSQENHLIFATGPVCGSLVWGSSRYGVFTKSPQTGFYSESYAGGRTPEAMDAAGYDAVVIKGKSKTPTVLVIDPQGVAFHEADDLWGMDTYESEDEAIKRFAKKNERGFRAGAVVIGPAGEHQVCFSVIENDHWRSAGRTGAGSIMGSKRLKAIVFQGDCRRRLADRNAVEMFAKHLAAEAKEHTLVTAYKSKGTPMMVKVMNEAGGFPTRYWSEGTYEKWQQISADALHERCEVRPRACLKCFMACGRMTKIRLGRHAGLRLEGPEYETIYAFGGLCAIDSIEEIIYLNDICDRLGMDTISAGNLCGLTIEAARRGKIDYAIDYGQVDAIAGLLKKIAFREGIGDLLARGIRAASEEWGLEDVAVHVKGLEPPGYDPRVLKGVGLGYATSDRGACHLRATFYKPELSGMIDPDAVEGKAAMFVDFEDRLTLFDALILCRFYRDLYPWEALCEIVQSVTGIEADKKRLKAISANISNMVRKFNIQEGLTPEDDRLPSRLHKEALKGGHRISEAELKKMVDDYYRLRGWDEQGKPRANHTP
ncbi:MAG: aldehyde ferredoxin oxidoreductase family protein [Deltaproteobacteria bacterium]|nr:aldehyde ferredoxin oxidoreductase family protein [Deltaproteobacteria bacterium]MBW2018736.1 aldehyde ferredoxin oxidoreductase family protein [Deltaproteobacteria bacterium]MBW2073465.1 aldehyde ferredoxin oxidoreductase family protein [Deltaproteobacteria bacterium]RLB83029.1 MAG: aldehyde:ferredoxin oxidoreductase [Deltaproteobacteria bacterium]